MKLKRMEAEKENGKANFIVKAVLLGALIVPGCSPNVVIHTQVYDPNADMAVERKCVAFQSCARTRHPIYLDSNGASGPVQSENAVLRAKGVENVGQTKGVRLELSACKKSAEAVFTPKMSAMMAIGDDSFMVTLDSLGYDGKGLLAEVILSAVCQADAGLGKDAGAKTDIGKKDKGGNP